MQGHESAATILLYHGVTSSPSSGIENFQTKHLPVEAFERQMDYLKHNTTPLTLRELNDYIQGETPLPPNSVAVTFDDAFKNVHDVALPVLKQYGIPATFFISTGFIGTNQRFWVDRVEHMVNMTRQESVEALLKNGSRRFTLHTSAEKASVALELKTMMKQMEPDERDRILTSIQDQTQVKDNGDTTPNYANLSWSDVLNLDNPPLYEVGGHTVNHEILSLLNDDELNYEIRECNKTLEQHLQHKIDLFSYPEGQYEHFNERVILELKRAGITICPSAVKGINYKGSDAFYLKRIMVGLMGERFPFPNFEGITD